jgi:hypothetical protein
MVSLTKKLHSEDDSLLGCCWDSLVVDRRFRGAHCIISAIAYYNETQSHSLFYFSVTESLGRRQTPAPVMVIASTIGSK